MTIKRVIAAILAAAAIFSLTLPVYAEAESESDFSMSESSFDPEQSFEQFSSIEVSEEASLTSEVSYEESYSQEYSYESQNDTSYETSTDYLSQDESSQDSSNEETSYGEESSNSEETSDQNSDLQSSEEESELSVADPFEKIRALQFILPADDPDYESKKKNQESSVILNKETGGEKGLINTPLPLSRSSSELDLYSEEQDSSFLMGVIIWSVIGVVVFILLILILNLKGGGDFSFGRKRYHKHSYKPMKGGRKKYKYSGRPRY